MSEQIPAGETDSLRGPSDPQATARPHQGGLIEALRLEMRANAISETPERIGAYKVLSKLGEGGMGIVYFAEQEKPIHRRVALKIIKPGMDTKQVMARFETEREALAMMNHANVAKVLDAGTTEQGRPYFVMEYVPGIPITEYCDKHRLNTKERLHLFIDVCNAVQHAHQKGIIHRDIKPSNVLVAIEELAIRAANVRGPALGAVVKVIDFGVAKATQHRLTEQTLFTEQGQLIGTPGYMSPEQAEMTALDIDTRTDIYSLGVLLYELLVGELPFDSMALRRAGLAEIQRIIREVDPPKPSTKFSSLGEASTSVAQKRHTEPRLLLRQIRGDLDWIVMKCLEKDRARRYDAANGLALEIQRYLNQEPVLAGPPSRAYRLRKFVRRNKGPVLAGALVSAILIIGIIGTSAGFARALRESARAEKAGVEAAAQRDLAEDAHAKAANERDRAEAAEQAARMDALQAERVAKRNEQVAYDFGIALAQQAHQGNKTEKLISILNRSMPRLRGWEWYHLRALSPRHAIAPEQLGRIRAIGFSPDGGYIFSCSDDGTAKIFDTATGALVRAISEHSGSVQTAAFSHDGGLFATGWEDGSVSVWHLTSGGQRLALANHTHSVTCLSFSPDAKHLASADSGGSVVVVDTATGRSEHVVACGSGGVKVLFYGPQGIISCGTSEGEIASWNSRAPEKAIRTQATDASEGISMAATRDGSQIVCTDWNAIRTVDLGGNLDFQTIPIAEPVQSIAVNPTGDRLAVVGASGMVSLFNRTTGLEMLVLASDQPCTTTAFSPDGRWLGAVTRNGAINIWDGSAEINIPSAALRWQGSVGGEEAQWHLAVQRGLSWLAEQQSPDGSFGSLSHYGPNTAITGLAGLAFLGEGSDTKQGRYAHVIQGCLSYILGCAGSSGLLVSQTSHGPMYDHSFAVLFLAAVFKKEANDEVGRVLAAAVRLIEQSQNAQGGWRYQPIPSDADISVTSCQVVALTAASNVGFSCSTETLRRAGEYIERCQNSDGGFRYMLDSGGSAFARSAAAVAALLYLGKGGESLRCGLDYVHKYLPPQDQAVGHYFYGHYYAAQAMWLAGGGRWGPWWPAIREELVEKQADDGSWPGQAGPEYGTAIGLIVLQFPSGTLPQLPARSLAGERPRQPAPDRP